MTFSPTFGRTFSPTFQPKSQAAVAGGGWWLTGGIAAANCIAAYQPKGAVDITASYVNLANPDTYNLTVGNAPAFNTATGWTFNGTGNYLITGIIPENDQTWSMIVKFSGVTSQNGLVGCEYGTNSRFYVYPRRSAAGDDHIFGNGGFLATGARIAEGVMAVAGANCYLNGSLEGQVNSTWGGTGRKITIGGLNVSADANGVAVTYTCDGTIPSMAIYDIDISSYVAGLTTAMAAL
jgi:hypothetical protein